MGFFRKYGLDPPPSAQTDQSVQRVATCHGICERVCWNVIPAPANLVHWHGSSDWMDTVWPALERRGSISDNIDQNNEQVLASGSLLADLKTKLSLNGGNLVLIFIPISSMVRARCLSGAHIIVLILVIFSLAFFFCRRNSDTIGKPMLRSNLCFIGRKETY